MRPLKLSIELVPQTSWYNNMRSLMPKDKWDVLRKRIFADFGYQCGICQAKGLLHCHEIWEYDDEHHVQKLKGFVALCELCHGVKHIGLASLQASKKKRGLKTIIEHFMKVNECSRHEFDKHYQEALELFEKRSKHGWKIAIGKTSGA